MKSLKKEMGTMVDFDMEKIGEDDRRLLETVIGGRDLGLSKAYKRPEAPDKDTPLDTEKHVRAALSYFSQSKNRAMYKESEQKYIWNRILKAAKKHGIEVSEGTEEKADLEKSALDRMVKAVDDLQVNAPVNFEEYSDEELSKMLGKSMGEKSGRTHVKYISRKPKSGGGWIYTYKNEKTGKEHEVHDAPESPMKISSDDADFDGKTEKELIDMEEELLDVLGSVNNSINDAKTEVGKKFLLNVKEEALGKLERVKSKLDVMTHHLIEGEENAKEAESPKVDEGKTEYVSAEETKKMIRGMLKEKFAGTKFSVKQPRGRAVYVGWKDGPAVDDVNRELSHYEGESFDAMIDLASPRHTIHDGKKVNFGVSYVFGQREYSKEFLKRVKDKFVAATGQGANVEIKEHSSGGAFFDDHSNERFGGRWLGSEMRRTADRLDEKNIDTADIYDIMNKGMVVDSFTDEEFFNMDGSELYKAMLDSMDALTLSKALGGYKYSKRIPKAGGGYRYVYEHPQYGEVHVERGEGGEWKAKGKTAGEHDIIVDKAEKEGDDDVVDEHTMLGKLVRDIKRYEGAAAEQVMRAAKREAKKAGVSMEDVLKRAVAKI